MSQPPYGTAYRAPVANRWATAALIAALLLPPAGIVLGVVARRQVRRTGEDGAGLAVAGILLGVALTVVWALLVAYFVYVFLNTADTLPARPIRN